MTKLTIEDKLTEPEFPIYAQHIDTKVIAAIINLKGEAVCFDSGDSDYKIGDKFRSGFFTHPQFWHRFKEVKFIKS